MSEQNWQAKRSYQGFSYNEVAKEIRRRAKGNNLFSKQENAQRLGTALKQARILFQLSSHLHDFLKVRRMTPGVLIKLLDNSDMNDGIEFSLDPFPKGTSPETIETDPLIDLFYPGSDYEVSRENGNISIIPSKKDK